LARRALICLAVLSFALLALTLYGWARTRHGGDRWDWRRQDYDDTGSRTETRAIVSRAGTLTFTHWVANYDWDGSRGLPHQPWKYRRTDGRHETWMSGLLPPAQFLGARRYVFVLGYTAGTRIDLPYWMPCAALAVLPAAVGLPRWRKRVRGARSGACATCGYDLRATPDRCPECGSTGPPAPDVVKVFVR
jgi:hypothetical protein